MQCNLRISLKQFLTMKISFSFPCAMHAPHQHDMHFLPLPEFAPEVHYEIGRTVGVVRVPLLAVLGCKEISLKALAHGSPGPKELCHSPASCTFFVMRLRLLKGCMLRALHRLLFGLVRYIQLGMALRDVLKSLERPLAIFAQSFRGAASKHAVNAECATMPCNPNSRTEGNDLWQPRRVCAVHDALEQNLGTA